MWWRQSFVQHIAALLALAAVTIAAQLLEQDDDPVRFRPITTFPPAEVPYKTHEVLQSAEKLHELLGVLLAALIVLVASGASIEGGAVLDAVFILVLKLGPNEAIPLASVTVFGGAVCDFLLNFRKKSVSSTDSLINWDFILMVQPMLLMGTVFGASIISWFSNWLLIIALIVYLAYIGKSVFKQTRVVGHEEGWSCCSGSGSGSLLGAPSSGFQNNDGGFLSRAGLPWRKAGINFGLFAATILLMALQGGKYFPSPLGIPPTSIFFLLVSLLPFFFLSVVLHYQMKGVVATYRRQQNPRFILAPNEVQWSVDTIRKLPLHLLGSGAAGGAFGVGSELSISRLLRGVNFPPAAVSAMAATTVLFVTGMASFSFFLWGKLDLHLAQFLMPLGFVTTLLGRLCLLRIARQSSSRTLLLVAIAATIVVSVFPLSFIALKGLFGL